MIADARQRMTPETKSDALLFSVRKTTVSLS